MSDTTPDSRSRRTRGYVAVAVTRLVRWVVPMVVLAAPPGPVAGQTVADSAWAAGDIALAERLYSAQLAGDGGSARALHRLALIRAWSEEFDASLELFDTLVSADPSNVEAALDRAKVLSWRDDLAGALAAYRATLDAHPESLAARLGIARVLSWDGRSDEAEHAYAEILERDPRNAEALAGHARVAAWDGRLEEAESRWRAALAIHPDDVVLLAGLGSTLRWAGRPRDASEVLERSIELGAGDEARQEYRLARLAIAPRLDPTVAYESDSDGNRIVTLHHDQSARPSRWLQLHARGYARTSTFRPTGETGRAYGGLVETRFRVGRGWEIETGAGVYGSSLGSGGPELQWRVRMATPGSLPVQGWARFSKRGLDETAPLMRNDVTVAEWSAGVRGGHGPWRGEVSASLAEYEGSARNERRGAVAGLSRRLGADWSVGATLRVFGFDEDLGDGYFDPARYGLLEAGLGWGRQYGAWRLSAWAAPGLQRVGTGSESLSAAFRGRGSVGYEIGHGRVFTLHAGYSSAGLRTFSTGDADYRYFSLALAAGWAF